MATTVVNGHDARTNHMLQTDMSGEQDPFVSSDAALPTKRSHRYSAHFDPDFFSLAVTSSPSQVKQTLQVHLAETERRLQDTQKLGNSLLQQQSDLNDRLKEVEQQQDEAEITPELRQRLDELEKEQHDVGREIARALLGPKSRNVSGEESAASEGPISYSSQATSSPTKVSAPSRKQRNQPAKRVGDIQFAADISTSLLAQVRQMQAMLAERDETLKTVNHDRSRLELEMQHFSSRLRALDENEQRYKDENWNLETQAHELKNAAQEASEREKKLNTALAAALAEKNRAQNEVDEVKMAHEKLAVDHVTAKKAHDSELHGLRRDMDLADSERETLQSRVDELTMQNQELARAMSSRFRGQGGATDQGAEAGLETTDRGLSTPEHSPPPSPIKATPRPGALESETLKSSLHHAHRMIQNLKGTVHREKTEKVELKRMIQDLRDELEQRRADGSFGSGSKRQKTKPDISRRIARPEMLGGTRRPRTDIELDDEDWEEHLGDGQTPKDTRLSVPGAFETPRGTDVSDAYLTANETDGHFETADEKHATESDDFQTGAESLAGDSTDELTEREDNPSRKPRGSLRLRPAGNRSSYLSTASTSAGEDEESQTPVQAPFPKYRLKNGRQSLRQARAQRESTPETFYSRVVSQESPATVTSDRSTPAAEQSLFAELGGLDDATSDRYDTPGRSSFVSQTSTPSGALFQVRSPQSVLSMPAKPRMMDSGTMTDPWQPEAAFAPHNQLDNTGGNPHFAAGADHFSVDQQILPSPSRFPLPPSAPTSPLSDADKAMQYTPSKSDQESPLKSFTNFITPPKTMWDEAQHEETRTPAEYSTGTSMTPQRPLGFSNVLAQATQPVTPVRTQVEPATVAAPFLAFSSIHSLDTAPIELDSASGPTTAFANTHEEPTQGSNAAGKAAGGAAAGGLLATAASMLGWAKPKDPERPVIAEDETSQDLESSSDANKLPLRDITGNSGPRLAPINQSVAPKPITASNNDEAVRQPSTSEEVEEGIRARKLAPIVIPVTDQIPQTSLPPNPTSAIRSTTKSRESLSLAEATPLKRPASANSQRVQSMNSRPPLPVDHKSAIARASTSIAPPGSAGREPANASHIATIMGPPIAPASAYRRPRTPAESMRSPTRDSTVTRPGAQHRHSTRERNVSRRSSVSSFASELDQRFNIRADAAAASHGFETAPGTDPRMIQAITQTMIGEFLWKYTRKAGSTDMSNTRHRRYFWVHPYTKTLYWSNSDPQSAGRTELRAKSVPIQSVRMVTDPNPMPPGLHGKSLEIVSKGRVVKVTAGTGARHEVWFNALSYLLHRVDTTGLQNGRGAGGHDHVTEADVNEFAVGGYGADRGGRSLLKPSGSRVSVSSYNSRDTSANPSVVRVPVTVSTAVSRGQAQPGTATSRAGATTDQNEQGKQREDGKDRTLRANSQSRFSRMLGSVTGTVRRRTGQDPGSLHGDQTDDAIYDASVVSQQGDEEEEMRQEMLRQERDGLGHRNGGLENVRSCCDGKHDVSTLSQAGRHSHSAVPTHRHSTIERINRSINKRGGGPSSVSR